RGAARVAKADTNGLEEATPSGLSARTQDSTLKTQHFGVVSADSGLRTQDSALRGCQPGLRTQHFGVVSADSGLRIRTQNSELLLPNPSPKLFVLTPPKGLRRPAQGCRLRLPWARSRQLIATLKGLRRRHERPKSDSE